MLTLFGALQLVGRRSASAHIIAFVASEGGCMQPGAAPGLAARLGSHGRGSLPPQLAIITDKARCPIPPPQNLCQD